MKAVELQQLEDQLSEYVRLARGGETILVSERNEVVAQLGPAQTPGTRAESLESTLSRLSGQAHLSRAQESKKGWRWQPVKLGLGPERSRTILDELRADR